MKAQIETVAVEEKGASSGQAPKNRRIGLAGGALLLAALLAVGILPRLAREREALAAVRESPVTHPVVSVIHPGKGQPTAELMLPGNIEPLYTANIYARANGYVDRRNVDIGARVKAGQVLAFLRRKSTSSCSKQMRRSGNQKRHFSKQARLSIRRKPTQSWLG